MNKGIIPGGSARWFNSAPPRYEFLGIVHDNYNIAYDIWRNINKNGNLKFFVQWARFGHGVYEIKEIQRNRSNWRKQVLKLHSITEDFSISPQAFTKVG